jgi:branched-chain amino acid transport system substrate-binding protein
MVNATPPNPMPSPTSGPTPLHKRPIVRGLGLVGLGLLGLAVFSQINSSPTVKTRISKGDRLLIPSDPNHPATVQRKLGIEAMVAKQFATAEKAFEAARAIEKNDPEILIYQNNARALVSSDGNPSNLITLAVSVPISTNLNVAQELLRGVAQAQDQKNTAGGIGGKLVQIVIADDSNDPSFSSRIANAFVEDSQILGVIGHNASDASLSAAPIYEDKKLVMISPTSSANRLTNFGAYIFRTVPGTRFMSDPLAEYAVKVLKSKRVGVCFDAKAIDNVSFKDDFVASIVGQGGAIVDVGCDIADPKFDPAQAIARLTEQEADSILIAPHIDRLDLALKLAEANTKNLPLLSSSTMYTGKVFQGKKAIENLVIPVLWHPSSNPKFSSEATTYWNGIVNWRTATAYDATQALISAIGMSTPATRSTIQSTLRSGSFATAGSGSEIRFLSTGDRAAKPILVQVKPKGNTYEFAPLTVETPPKTVQP